ncbi:hypothetical protein AB94_4269 [Escherichia coli 5-366-08_S3_C1]|nr:hypothetical protein AB94_4269 [Escherichia coli 5-366-08_S3_C1]
MVKRRRLRKPQNEVWQWILTGVSRRRNKEFTENKRCYTCM